MNRMNRLGFWLMPPKQIQAEYKQVIDKYSSQLKTPSFEPHITILDTVKGDKKEIIEKVKEAAFKLSPIQILFTDITMSTTYHQCVFARVKPTPSLLDAHLKLKTALKHAGESMYVPHMSLVYGDLSSREKYKIAEEIKLLTKSFKADRLGVVNVDNLDPKTWIHEAEFLLRALR